MTVQCGTQLVTERGAGHAGSSCDTPMSGEDSVPRQLWPSSAVKETKVSPTDTNMRLHRDDHGQQTPKLCIRVGFWWYLRQGTIVVQRVLIFSVAESHTLGRSGGIGRSTQLPPLPTHFRSSNTNLRIQYRFPALTHAHKAL